MPLSPKASDLCLAADVAADLGITSDDRVQRAVSVASQAIADYCNRVFERAVGIVEYPAGYDRPLLILSRPPIVSIASITEEGVAVASGDYESVGPNADAGLVLHKSRGWLNTTRLDRFSVSDTYANAHGQSDEIVATYTGGYVTPGQNALDAVTYPAVTLPDNLQEAARYTAVSVIRGRGVDPKVALEAIGDWQIRYFDRNDADAIPAFARGLLAPYVRLKL